MDNKSQNNAFNESLALLAKAQRDMKVSTYQTEYSFLENNASQSFSISGNFHTVCSRFFPDLSIRNHLTFVAIKSSKENVLIREGYLNLASAIDNVCSDIEIDIRNAIERVTAEATVDSKVARVGMHICNKDSPLIVKYFDSSVIVLRTESYPLTQVEADFWKDAITEFSSKLEDLCGYKFYKLSENQSNEVAGFAMKVHLEKLHEDSYIHYRSNDHKDYKKINTVFLPPHDFMPSFSGTVSQTLEANWAIALKNIASFQIGLKRLDEMFSMVNGITCMRPCDYERMMMLLSTLSITSDDFVLRTVVGIKTEEVKKKEEKLDMHPPGIRNSLFEEEIPEIEGSSSESDDDDTIRDFIDDVSYLNLKG